LTDFFPNLIQLSILLCSQAFNFYCFENETDSRGIEALIHRMIYVLDSESLFSMLSNIIFHTEDISARFVSICALSSLIQHDPLIIEQNIEFVLSFLNASPETEHHSILEAILNAYHFLINNTPFSISHFVSNILHFCLECIQITDEKL
jgi:hypothetical protein